MANPVAGAVCSKNVTLRSATVAATDEAVSTHVGIETFTSATLMFEVTAASGTSPTLDVYVQTLLPDGSTYQDLVHFTQATGATKQVVCLIPQSAAPFTISTAGLAAGTAKSMLMGHTWRVWAVVGGTNPSFTFSVKGDFLQ